MLTACLGSPEICLIVTVFNPFGVPRDDIVSGVVSVYTLGAADVEVEVMSPALLHIGSTPGSWRYHWWLHEPLAVGAYRVEYIMTDVTGAQVVVSENLVVESFTA